MTDIGVRVPDVVWGPTEVMVAEANRSGPAEVCPPLVAEVTSPGNRPGEIQRKAEAYLRAGARDVLVVHLDGRIECHTDEGVAQQSAMAGVIEWPEGLFPQHGA